MSSHGTASDKGIGLAAALSFLTAVGAILMYLNPEDPVSAWGFALAMLAASLAVVAAQVYPGR